MLTYDEIIAAWDADDTAVPATPIEIAGDDAGHHAAEVIGNDAIGYVGRDYAHDGYEVGPFAAADEAECALIALIAKIPSRI